MARLLAAMSGGVDSSVAALLACREGHDLTGVTLKQWEHPDEETRLVKGCCTLDAVDDARRAADLIAIPHYTFDFREVFEREVVDPFVDAYASGRTPNPCVRCNERVRFGALLDKARALGFEGIVTGHYARVHGGRLHRAACREKDQSYVLHALGPEALARVTFPLGTFATKHEVRSLAREAGLRNWSRSDSVDVCFIDDGQRPGDLVARRAAAHVAPGPIVDRTGRVVGRHRGLAYYTVGQRRGLGPVASRRAAYVTELDASRNAVVVGDDADLWASGLVAVRPRFAHGPPRDGARVRAMVRYREHATPATFTSTADGFRLAFDEPVRAVTPGQAAVIYDGDEVLGGGTIERAA